MLWEREADLELGLQLLACFPADRHADLAAAPGADFPAAARSALATWQPGAQDWAAWRVAVGGVQRLVGVAEVTRRGTARRWLQGVQCIVLLYCLGRHLFAIVDSRTRG